jgi:guanylate kinase
MHGRRDQSPRDGGDAPERGAVFIISAPSGAGKTTLCKRLIEALPGIDFSVSYTTRPPRAGERPGVDYHFVSGAEFERRRQAGEFIEWAVVDGQTYGTSAVAVREATATGRDILLDIDTQGAESIRRRIPDAVLIFVLPPSMGALRARLERRGTDGQETVSRRLSLARGEIEKASSYDYLIVNEDLEATFDELRSIVVAARCRRERRAARLERILSGFTDEPAVDR